MANNLQQSDAVNRLVFFPPLLWLLHLWCWHISVVVHALPCFPLVNMLGVLPTPSLKI